MSTAAEAALSAAFDALAEQFSGVTFRGAALLALINTVDPRERTNPNFTLKADSVVIVKRSALTSAPRVGESMTDNNGRHHRIVDVRPEPLTWRIYCQSSAA